MQWNLENSALLIIQPLPCREKKTYVQTRYKQDIISDAENNATVLVNENTLENNEDVTVEDIVQAPKISHREKLKAAETFFHYFKHGTSAIELLLFRSLRAEAAKSECSSMEDNIILRFSFKEVTNFYKVGFFIFI
ncbi:hypothetical protein TNCV_2703181 [Trichonephila clavipes]|nr:hypothetical protein TNCV_2703181 [Trichonephila clavipes]